ncbi:uncharacterized protein LOC112517749 [Cynara cardunculus var. scolymus]|uniref:Uncharacterized protein n=1 Tax=Cynara cardunculus var. scolymus TaxID=59895 RepID=A0A103XQ30_CYNCS|nr:uncharacterized protein LOC112517749 [Cynara cardunculus var. scolymus]KVH94745.1 hypothetical protein Ccrd_003188 [Cynara cardunculus var. scolymus]
MVLRVMRVERWNDDQLPPLVEAPPLKVAESPSTHRSMETLVVVLAIITIVGVIAGFIARLCGGRHYDGNGGDHEIEGWIESRCRSCIDAGISPPPPPPPAVAAAAAVPAPQEEAKK